ncbi:hypothetical protein G5V57_19095 [Nordella sp. HKS 07]|uniref:hypothetical protein n=1 Tax=Nordella sp. HKS 07 TaxID=2712222 RepID=UPI0013E14EA0|nr:hypothetical protein [Nordella sp. HKS 07]QIG49634.1 hypothetical protein G5V57_19095 [Nordella sp. HKS 07]
MRRILTIAALAASLLTAGGPAYAQSPTMQPQPKLQIQPKAPARPPMITLSQATKNIQTVMPTARVLKIGPLPSGDIVATIKIENQVKKVRVNGQTGAVQN